MWNSRLSSAMYWELTRSQQRRTLNTETKRLAGWEKAAISLQFPNILTLGRKRLQGASTPQLHTAICLCQAGKRAHRATAAYGAALLPTTHWLSACLLGTGKDSCLYWDGWFSPVLGPCAYRAGLLLRGAGIPHIVISFHSFLRNTEAILGIDLCFWVSEKIEKSKEKMLFKTVFALLK